MNYKGTHSHKLETEFAAHGLVRGGLLAHMQCRPNLSVHEELLNMYWGHPKVGNISLAKMAHTALSKDTCAELIALAHIWSFYATLYFSPNESLPSEACQHTINSSSLAVQKNALPKP